MKKMILLVLIFFSLSPLVYGGRRIYEPQEFAPNQYVIYGRGKSMAKIMSIFTKEANEYCHKNNQQMQLISSKKMARHQFEYKFTCIPATSSPIADKAEQE